MARAKEKKMGTYLLSFRDTPVWEKYRNDPEGFPEASKVRYFLESHGITFADAFGDNVKVYANGDVSVTCQNDPSIIWPQYDDALLPEDAQRRVKLLAMKQLRDKFRNTPGQITANDRDNAIEALLTMALKLFPDQT